MREKIFAMLMILCLIVVGCGTPAAEPAAPAGSSGESEEPVALPTALDPNLVGIFSASDTYGICMDECVNNVDADGKMPDGTDVRFCYHKCFIGACEEMGLSSETVKSVDDGGDITIKCLLDAEYLFPNTMFEYELYTNADSAWCDASCNYKNSENPEVCYGKCMLCEITVNKNANSEDCGYLGNVDEEGLLKTLSEYREMIELPGVSDITEHMLRVFAANYYGGFDYTKATEALKTWDRIRKVVYLFKYAQNFAGEPSGEVPVIGVTQYSADDQNEIMRDMRNAAKFPEAGKDVLKTVLDVGPGTSFSESNPEDGWLIFATDIKASDYLSGVPVNNQQEIDSWDESITEEFPTVLFSLPVQLIDADNKFDQVRVINPSPEGVDQVIRRSIPIAQEEFILATNLEYLTKASEDDVLSEIALYESAMDLPGYSVEREKMKIDDIFSTYKIRTIYNAFSCASSIIDDGIIVHYKGAPADGNLDDYCYLVYKVTRN
ncbi:MAG: hypothetical protein KKF44_07495 [Nanoarchaeota archaeon]|nr:hypothetical protein [Nanoarchaeota archaeon]